MTNSHSIQPPTLPIVGAVVQGVQGAQGAQGPAQGAQGAQGGVGTQGNQGQAGNQGSQGSTGSQGQVGSQGQTGNQGSQGTPGSQGNQGTQGVQGFQGSAASGLTAFTSGSAAIPALLLGASQNVVVTLGNTMPSSTFNTSIPMTGSLLSSVTLVVQSQTTTTVTVEGDRVVSSRPWFSVHSVGVEMTRKQVGPEIAVEVYNTKTKAPLANAVVTVAPLIYTDPDFLNPTTTLTANAIGICTGYGTPGTYVFTSVDPKAGPIESVQIIANLGIGGLPALTGNAGEVLTVNPTETGIEWEPGGSGGGTPTTIDGGNATGGGSTGSIDGGNA